MIDINGGYITIHAILLFPISVFAVVGFLWLWGASKDIAKAVFDDWMGRRELRKWRRK